MAVRAMLDTALDRTVLLGYARTGYWLRRPNWAPGDPAAGSLRGKVAVVTGANSGLGKETSAGLARLGASVIMVARNCVRGEQALAELTAELPGADIRLEICDISSLQSVRALASRLLAGEHPIDIIVHNAGALSAARTESVDGHELSLATHVLGPLLLTELLLPALHNSDDARIIMVSSGGMYTQPVRAADPEYMLGNYRGAVAYSRSKRMQVALAPLLAQRWGITVNSMHPGWADTPGVVSSLPGFHRIMKLVLRTPAEGADTAIWLAATNPSPDSDQFWHDRRIRPQHYLPATRTSAGELQRLWEYCAQVCGIH